MGRVMTEMVRPCTRGDGHGGFNDYTKLRMAGLARAIQTKLYLHSCSKKYCLQNRSTCRFFFPWPSNRRYCCYICDRTHAHVAVKRVFCVNVFRPLQPQQQYDENTERIAGMRRLVEDDCCWTYMRVRYC